MSKVCFPFNIADFGQIKKNYGQAGAGSARKMRHKPKIKTKNCKHETEVVPLQV